MTNKNSYSVLVKNPEEHSPALGILSFQHRFSQVFGLEVDVYEVLEALELLERTYLWFPATLYQAFL